MSEHRQTSAASRPNILVIMSDEHSPFVTGCYGNTQVRTPHLDALARDSSVFDRAYCNSPICVPSRMSFLTGKYTHKIGVWDLDSRLPAQFETYAARMSRLGYETALCGRMHITGSDRLRGFDKRLVDDREEWLTSIVVPDRGPESRRWSNSHVSECGPGMGENQIYDRIVAETAVEYLKEKANEKSGKPWLLTVGFMSPHFPLIAPREFYDLYDPALMPLPDLHGETFETQHPVIRQLRYFFRTETDLPESLVREALTCYYALVSYTDFLVGMILEAVDQSPLKDNTVVIYVSDHGEMAGQHGLWQKNCFYEPSVRIPMMVRIPGMSGGKRIADNVSLVDFAPTFLELAGLPPGESDGDGQSIMNLIRGSREPERIVFSEYHAQGMLNAGYMILKGDWKFNYYVGERPQLFNIVEDPHEICDLASHPDFAGIVADLKNELYRIVNPEEVNRLAHLDQERRRKSRTRQ